MDLPIGLGAGLAEGSRRTFPINVVADRAAVAHGGAFLRRLYQRQHQQGFFG